LKPLSYAELTTDQRAFAEREISSGHGKGALNIYLRGPETAELSRPFSDYLRFNAPEPHKFKEIAIMLTSRYWGGSAMAAGERPANMSADEATVYDFCTQLLTTRQVSDKNFEAMSALVGEHGIVELVAPMGQYTGLTMLFVVDRYPVPAGAPDEVNKPM
jgi:4-carboxymuconolactone decarboxylase